jgi:hypothetical protein
MSTMQSYALRSGWVTFAAIVLIAVGIARIISAILFFDDSNEVANLTNGLWGDQLWLWGLWDLCVAALAIFGGWSLMSDGGFGRVVAYVWAILVIIQGFLILAGAPWYAAFAITIALLVVYGLATSPSRAQA